MYLATRSTDRVVRPFEWGDSWTRDWPVESAETEPEARLLDINRQVMADSQRFFDYKIPNDYRLTNGWLQFTSPVDTPHSLNNTVHARYFPAKERWKRGRKAVVVLPHWNANASQHVGLCEGIAALGITALRLSLPYHDHRMPPELHRADFAVSANVARTIHATRQAVIDLRACYDWLEREGFEDLGIVGTSLGSCYAFLASAHDQRLKTNVFNHCSTTFADVVWTGQSTKHIRAGIEGEITLDRLRGVWDCVSPVHYIRRFAEMKKKSFFLYTTYDTTFRPEFSRAIVEQIRLSGADHKLVVLPCGHYTLGESPFKFIVGYQIINFLKRNL